MRLNNTIGSILMITGLVLIAAAAQTLDGIPLSFGQVGHILRYGLPGILIFLAGAFLRRDAFRG